jgi:hypothetical protein
MGQGLSNESKFEKIGRLEPEIWVDKEIASKWKIYIFKLKPVNGIERLIKMKIFVNKLISFVKLIKGILYL